MEGSTVGRCGEGWRGVLCRERSGGEYCVGRGVKGSTVGRCGEGIKARSPRQSSMPGGTRDRWFCARGW